MQRTECSSYLNGHCPNAGCPYNHDDAILEVVFPDAPLYKQRRERLEIEQSAHTQPASGTVRVSLPPTEQASPNSVSAASSGPTNTAASRGNTPPADPHAASASAANPHGVSSQHPGTVPVKRKEACTFHLQGKCQRGDSCPFSHDQYVSSATPSVAVRVDPQAPSASAANLHLGSSQHPGTVPQKQKVPACYFHFLGSCERGDSCPYSHDWDACSGTDCPRYLASRCPFTKDHKKCPMVHDPVKRSRVHCKHYLQGNCRLGDKCYRNHNDDELRRDRPNAPRFRDSRAIVTGDGDGDGDATESIDDDNDCDICCEHIERDERCNPLSCGHDQFHNSCISSWIERDPTCPLCRAVMKG